MADLYAAPYLDSNVWIGWIKGEFVRGVDRAAIADQILAAAEPPTSGYKIHTSALTLAEVYKLRQGPRLLPDDPQTAAAINRFLDFCEHEYVEIIDVDRYIGIHAHHLCVQYGILPNDAIHLACALRAKCDVLLAWDDRFVNVTRHGINEISVEEPRLMGQGKLTT